MTQFVMRLADFEGTWTVHNGATFKAVYLFYYTVAASMLAFFFLLFDQVSPEHPWLRTSAMISLGLFVTVTTANCFREPADAEGLEDSIVVRLVFGAMTLAYWWFCFLILAYLQRNK